jgi:Transposase domain (DUF772)
MMGQQSRTESLFYYFRLEEQITIDHLRIIASHVDFSFIPEELKDFDSPTGRPYLYGITSERRLMEEVRMHLAFRWFTPVLSKNFPSTRRSPKIVTVDFGVGYYGLKPDSR